MFCLNRIKFYHYGCEDLPLFLLFQVIRTLDYVVIVVLLYQKIM